MDYVPMNSDQHGTGQPLNDYYNYLPLLESSSHFGPEVVKVRKAVRKVGLQVASATVRYAVLDST